MSFNEKLRDKVSDYCFKEGCSFAKKSETFNECENSKKCQIWQFLKWTAQTK